MNHIDLSDYPAIQACVRQHVAYGTILDFDIFVNELDRLLKELTKYREQEEATDYAHNSK